MQHDNDRLVDISAQTQNNMSSIQWQHITALQKSPQGALVWFQSVNHAQSPSGATILNANLCRCLCLRRLRQTAVILPNDCLSQPQGVHDALSDMHRTNWKHRRNSDTQTRHAVISLLRRFVALSIDSWCIKHVSSTSSSDSKKRGPILSAETVQFRLWKLHVRGFA